MRDVTRSALPFVAVFLLAVLVLAYVPSITLFLPAARVKTGRALPRKKHWPASCWT